MNAPQTPDLAAEFFSLCGDYVNSADSNDRLHTEFTARTWAEPVLASHRQHVETAKLGYGDAAFHHLWLLLLAAAHQRFGPISALEIGVFKGQTISLWALLSREHHIPVHIHAITPLEGQPIKTARWWRSLRYRFDRHFREKSDSGSFYPVDDYEAIVRAHFAFHGLDFDQVVLMRGYSTAPAIREHAATSRYQLLYIDGDHTYAGVVADIEHYAPLVAPGGWLVMDDASFDQPGTVFWKGYDSVARACQLLPSFGFKNVLNIGHNRVFERFA